MDYQKFLDAPTGNVCDANGGRGVMDAGIHPLDRHMKVAGRALTVACAAGDNLTIHKAVLLAQPGDVLVINCGGYLNAGVFGEMLALSCMAILEEAMELITLLPAMLPPIMADISAPMYSAIMPLISSWVSEGMMLPSKFLVYTISGRS